MEICEKTTADILWSSTWRKLPEYSDIKKAQEMFDRRDLPGEKLIRIYT